MKDRFSTCNSIFSLYTEESKVIIKWEWNDKEDQVSILYEDKEEGLRDFERIKKDAEIFWFLLRKKGVKVIEGV